jgi:dolichyl-phosphate-mannose-protein mannosyltransferase
VKPPNRLELVLAGAALLFCLALRLLFLGMPARPLYDETVYLPQARLTLEGKPADMAHPPLALAFITSGMKLIPGRPWGWRLPSVLAAVLSLLLLYLLGRRLGGPRLGGIAAGLLALDPIFFVMGRLAMLDIFLTMFLLAFAYFWSLGWRAAAGICLGLAAACKWPALFVPACLLLILLGRLLVGKLRPQEALREAGFLLLLPAALYLAVYLALDPMSLSCFIAVHRQKFFLHLFDFPKDLPYNSRWWSWIAVPQTCPVHSQTFGSLTSYISEISLRNNPALLWPGALGFLYCLYLALRRKNQGAALAAGMFAALYFPWALLSRAQYLFYLLPTLPFLYLCAAYFLTALAGSRIGRYILIGYLLFALATFVALFPTLTGVSWWHP